MIKYVPIYDGINGIKNTSETYHLVGSETAQTDFISPNDLTQIRK